MLIVNADDWGRSRAETDAALECFNRGRISSVSAMVFMQDSERAAGIAKASGIDVGLHLNFDEPFTGGDVPGELQLHHDATRSYLTSHKFSQLLYHPILTRSFRYSFVSQLDEFRRLYAASPSHFDGHHHMHLCANVVFGNVIPKHCRIRRTFSFFPGERGLVNRTYRHFLDRSLRRKYHLPDYFFDLSDCLRSNKIERAAALSSQSVVEVMSHPIDPDEMNYLRSPESEALVRNTQLGCYSDMSETTSVCC